jgi:hypothetical protein
MGGILFAVYQRAARDNGHKLFVENNFNYYANKHECGKQALIIQ